MIPEIILTTIGDWNQIVCDLNFNSATGGGYMGEFSNCILNVVAFGDAWLLALEMIGVVIFMALAFGLPAGIMLPISTILFYTLWVITGGEQIMLIGFALSLIATAYIWWNAIRKGGE